MPALHVVRGGNETFLLPCAMGLNWQARRAESAGVGLLAEGSGSSCLLGVSARICGNEGGSVCLAPCSRSRSTPSSLGIHHSISSCKARLLQILHHSRVARIQAQRICVIHS